MINLKLLECFLFYFLFLTILLIQFFLLGRPLSAVSSTSEAGAVAVAAPCETVEALAEVGVCLLASSPCGTRSGDNEELAFELGRAFEELVSDGDGTTGTTTFCSCCCSKPTPVVNGNKGVVVVVVAANAAAAC